MADSQIGGAVVVLQPLKLSADAIVGIFVVLNVEGILMFCFIQSCVDVQVGKHSIRGCRGPGPTIVNSTQSARQAEDSEAIKVSVHISELV
jgi:hypothetical protein